MLVYSDSSNRDQQKETPHFPPSPPLPPHPPQVLMMVHGLAFRQLWHWRAPTYACRQHDNTGYATTRFRFYLEVSFDGWQFKWQADSTRSKDSPMLFAAFFQSLKLVGKSYTSFELTRALLRIRTSAGPPDFSAPAQLAGRQRDSPTIGGETERERPSLCS